MLQIIFNLRRAYLLKEQNVVKGVVKKRFKASLSKGPFKSFGLNDV